jgi:hypothetical protein
MFLKCNIQNVTGLHPSVPGQAFIIIMLVARSSLDLEGVDCAMHASVLNAHAACKYSSGMASSHWSAPTSSSVLMLAKLGACE